MAFKVTFAGLDEMSHHQFATEVQIERHIYQHSRARIILQWDDPGRYDTRQTASLAAKMLGCTMDVLWQDVYLGENIDCFHGYVEHVSGERDAAKSRLIVEGVSFSRRTDLVPRYRAFQACKLLDICQQVAQTEPLIKIDKADDLNFDIDLSLQYGETDFQYLSRMLHAWGVPMSVTEKTGEVTLGARGTDSSGKFPDAAYGWKQVAFVGALQALPKLEAGGSGPTSQARGQVGTFNGQLKDKARDYYPATDSQPIRERLSAVQSQIDTSHYRLCLESAVLPFVPGQVIKFEGQDHLIRRVGIEGDPSQSAARQTFELQALTLPYQPGRRLPEWPSRTVWAHVMDNEKDPTQTGRVQVKFDWEPLDPQSSGDRAWLHTLTPYGAGKSVNDDKAGEYSGFYSLPEVGEHVLVQFLGEWDSEAVIIGTVRESAVSPMYNAKDTKRWRTPSGNEVTMTTKGSQDIVRIKTQDKLMFQGMIDGSDQSVTMICADSQSDMIHYQAGSGPSQLFISCGGDMYLKAAQKMQIEAGQIQIKATMGMVNIDGMPNVMINCGPQAMSPPSLTEPDEETMSTETKQRTLPAPVGTVAASASDPAQNADPTKKKKTWIEIVLKDNQGNPIPNERYSIKLPDGSTMEGTLDSEGRARVDGIDPGSAQVSFPDREGSDWKPA